MLSLYLTSKLFLIVSGCIIASTTASAPNIPDFIALWVPLILGTLTIPALQPIKRPPEKARSGHDWTPPSLMALAP